MALLEVLDHGELIAFSFEDLLKYHGRGAIGGVAHGFKVMERALPLLAAGEPPERHDINVETAFEGPGARDAFEMVTRAFTEGRYRVDPDLAGDDVPPSPNGRYFFRIAYGEGPIVDLTLRHGLVRDELLELVRRGAATPEEKDRLVWLKQDMADRLVGLPAEDVYDAVARSREAGNRESGRQR
jgi:hypothetical protein